MRVLLRPGHTRDPFAKAVPAIVDPRRAFAKRIGVR